MPRFRFVVCELAANGFGDPETLMNTRADLIADAYEYLLFKGKYETQAWRLRQKDD
jgi:hypothetical protein